MAASMVGGRVVVRVVVILTILAGLASCNPYFPDGSTLTTVVEGDGVRISWDPAKVDAGKTVGAYRVDVDGAQVTRVDGSLSTCVLSGLSAGADHDVVVTAYDSAGGWSAGTDRPSVTATVTGPAGSSGTSVRCDADISVVVSQPSQWAGTKLIGGQVAPVTYEVTVLNRNDRASGAVTVSNPVPVGTTLVADSPSCGDATNCTVDVVAGAVQWTLLEVPAESSLSVSFSVTVNPEFGSITEITDQATYTVAGGPACDAPPCTTNTVVNAAEPWRWTNGKPVWINPRNTVFYSGLNTFEPYFSPDNDRTRVTNDPAATTTVEWSCYPDYLCLIDHTDGEKVTFNFVWDPDDFQMWAMYLKATATQGDRTLTYETFMEFSLEKGSIFTTG